MIAYADVLRDAWVAHMAPRADDAPTVVSTFAGCGGSSLGYSMAGYRELLAVEWDDNAVATFRLNFPGVPIYHGDIARLSVDEVLERTGLARGELDVFDGSPPCQGFSTAGKRSFGDDRNQLFREYVRLLDGLQPQAFVMENVSGMVKGKMRLIFVEILKALKACGYQVSARLLNAMYFGVPQSRQRVIFVGVRGDLDVEPTHPVAMGYATTARQALDGLASIGLPGRPASSLMAQRWQETTRGSAHAERFSLLRLAWNKPAPTILQIQGSGGHMHPDEPRRLGTRELQRLASFPDEFVFLGDHERIVNRIGNTVPPLFMRAIAQHVRAELLQKAVRP